MSIKKFIKNLTLKIVFFLFFVLDAIYWTMAKTIMKIWGRRGLHLISVGEFKSGSSKKRSIFREDMLLRAIPVFVNFREKSCLDIACNDGFWSFRFGRLGIKRLTGVDTGEMEIARANFLKHVNGFPSFKFVRTNIFDFLYNENTDTYDVVLLLSLIYHLPDPKLTNYEEFFSAIAKVNNDCLVIDSRWFDDDDYWFDKTSNRTVIKTPDGVIKKWRPTRKDICLLLNKSGYERVIEANPAVFIDDAVKQQAFGDGDPYSVENVADYITNNRSLLFAYKSKKNIPVVDGDNFAKTIGT